MTCASASIPQETWTCNSNNKTNKEKQRTTSESKAEYFSSWEFLCFDSLPLVDCSLSCLTLLYLRRFVVQVLMHNRWGLTMSRALWEDGVELKRACCHSWLLLIEPKLPLGSLRGTRHAEALYCVMAHSMTYMSYIQSIYTKLTKELLPLMYNLVMPH